MKCRYAPVVGLALAAACAQEPVAPTDVIETPRMSVIAQSIDTLPSGGASNTVLAKAVSPRGWVLGDFYRPSGGPLRALSWSPSPDYLVKTITDTGAVYSGADAHGDVTAHISGRGPVVYVADAASEGHPYAVFALKLPVDAGNSGNWVAYGLNDDHVVVGHGYRGDGMANPVVWVPTAPQATSWRDPISLPLPDLPLGVSWVGTNARGVNAAGLVVGTVVERLARGSAYRAWHWRVQQVDGVWTVTSLGALPWAPGSLDQMATDVNDAGVIFGWVGELGKEFAALWYPDAAGGYTQPPRVREGQTWNTSHINRCGWAVSTLMAGRGRDGGNVAWDGTTAIALPSLPGASSSKSFDINDDGIVAGASYFAGKGKTPSRQVATVWRGFVPPCP